MSSARVAGVLVVALLPGGRCREQGTPGIYLAHAQPQLEDLHAVGSGAAPDVSGECAILGPGEQKTCLVLVQPLELRPQVSDERSVVPLRLALASS
jgi:hypothetical protein